jgi:hypothetical protein
MKTRPLTAALRTLALGLLLAAAPLLAPGAAAQTAQGTAAARDAAELAAYRMTEEGLAKFAAATRSLAVASRSAEAIGDVTAGREDLVTAMAEAFEARPPLREAIVGAGMTSREYALFTMALIQASLGVAIVEANPAAIDHLPADVSKENVRFVQAHRAALDALQADLQAAQ